MHIPCFWGNQKAKLPNKGVGSPCNKRNWMIYPWNQMSGAVSLFKNWWFIYYYNWKTIHGIVYWDMLEHYAVPQIPVVCIFQPDGTLPHYANHVRDQVFNGHWIGRGGPMVWPPRSPDLTSLDLFLREYIKDISVQISCCGSGLFTSKGQRNLSNHHKGDASKHLVIIVWTRLDHKGFIFGNLLITIKTWWVYLCFATNRT